MNQKNKIRMAALIAGVTVLVTTTVIALVLPISHSSSHQRLLVGVYEPNSPGTYGQLNAFAQDTGYQPGMVSYYSQWGLSFNTTFADEATAHHAEVLVQIQPTVYSVRQIAAGISDAYITAYAKAVKSYGHRVILSFGQEMNGNWYSWGAGHTSPDDFIAAWRHIVTLFRAAGATNVTWLWDPNCDYQGSQPVFLWWPGAAYVDWVGVDCYYAYSTDTFSSLFSATVNDIKAITNDPIIIGETGVTESAKPSTITELFAGAQAAGLTGIVYFDVDQSGDPYHQNWRLEDDTADLAAFRVAAKSYGTQSDLQR